MGESVGEVILPKFTTLLPIPVDRVCDAAKDADLTLCIVVGVDRHGDFYFASSEGDYGMVLWQLERAKRALFEMSDNERF